MTVQPDFQQVGEDFLAHYGKMGMKWGHRTGSGWVGVSNKLSKAKKNASTKVTTAKQNTKTVYKKVANSQGTASAKQIIKTTGSVAIRIGATQAFGILGIVGVVAVSAIIKENPVLIQSGKDFVTSRFTQ